MRETGPARPATSAAPAVPAGHRSAPPEGVLGSMVEAVKPRLRGWLHLGTFPVALAAGVLLVVLAPTSTARLSAVVFGLTSSLLFGTSAVYHRGHWQDRTRVLLKRADHANIFLIIAGTYTPFALLLLEPARARTLLWIVWGGALGGVLFRVFWVGAPRWLYTPVYIAMGWVAVAYLPAFERSGGPVLVALVVLGGLLYTAGGVVYALKRPDPSPRWFGFHEIFHACTVVAFLAHLGAVGIAVLGHA